MERTDKIEKGNKKEGVVVMPIKVPDNLPAKEILTNERIFVMDESRAYHQDIRPLKIAILNLMPLKETTEVQLLRLLGNTPLQIETVLLHPKSHDSKNTSPEHLKSFYHVFDEIKQDKFDGFIITGAPIELYNYEEVNYWEELVEIMEWSKENVTSTMHICWGAQAGLYYHYGVPKYTLNQKMFGVFPHKIKKYNVNLLRGFDDLFFVPHSRHTEVRIEDVAKVSELEILAESKESGLYIAATRNGSQIFVMGHSEYDPLTLKAEFDRDTQKGMKNVPFPRHYFEEDDPSKPPIVQWRSHSNLLFSNWLNYYVYQETPYDLEKIREKTSLENRK